MRAIVVYFKWQNPPEQPNIPKGIRQRYAKYDTNMVFGLASEVNELLTSSEMVL